MEAQQVIKAVLHNRLTTIVGVPGIGKSTTADFIKQYLQARNRFEDGVELVTLTEPCGVSGLISMMH